MSDRVRGTVQVNERGFGFLEWNDGEERSAFITPADLRPFLHLDQVSAHIRDGDKGPVARDLELELRVRTTLFGTMARSRKRTVVQPDPEVANAPWRVLGSDVGEPKAGTPVVAEVVEGGVHIRAVVAPEDVPVARIRDRYLIRHPFPDEVTEAARGLRPRRDPSRRDLRDLTTITIDAPSSRDLDDALSASPADSTGAIRFFVHIADVDATVPAGSPVDREARCRGTSVYIAGGMTPMIPRTLSEDRLSLLPGKERQTLTVELRIDAEGAITSTDLYASTIRSDQRLSYVDVDTFLSGGELDLSEPVLDTLSWLRTVSGRLAAVRAARGGVHFDRTELRIELDEEQEPVRIEARRETPAHRLIERTMVAANEAVAAWMRARGLPALYRVHPSPTADRVDELEESLDRMGFTPALAAPLTPRQLAALEAQLADAGLQPVLQEILAQILDRARYTVTRSGHFGLGSDAYLHFTSPIRRYADLSVHRVLKSFLGGHRSWDVDDPELATLATHLNECNARAAKAEAARRRELTARWAAEHIGMASEGHIIAVKSFGLVVQLEKTGVSGVVPVADLPGKWRREGHRLVGDEATWAIGDPIRVKINRVDEDRGHIDLAIHTPSRRRRRRRRRR